MSRELINPDEDTVEALLLQCPLCASARLKNRAVEWKGGLFSLCQTCGFIFQNPVPDAAASRQFYEQRYYADLKAAEPKIRQARSAIYEDVLRRLESEKRTGKILDVGAGFGDFMSAAETCGWQSWGLEPSREAWESAHSRFGERMLFGTAEEAVFEKGSFDAVTLWNVLDCLPDPSVVLHKIRIWLRPGGVLILRTPNAHFHYRLHRFYRLGRPFLKKLGWKKEASVFLRSNFSRRTIQMCLEKNKFCVRSVENGLMTSGDPYGVLRSANLMRFLKGVIFGAVRVAACVSGGRWLAGPNLLVVAECPESEETPEGRALRQAMARRLFLKRWALHVLAVFGYLLGLPLWRQLFSRETDTCVLLYHSVTAGLPGEMSVSLRDFEAQLDFLQRKYTVISAEEAISKRGQNKATKVVITFDDGYEDNYRNAFPALRSRKIPALIFLLAGGAQAERRTAHLGETGYYPSRLLTWASVREMADAGIEFGSHGVTHARLTTLSQDDLHSELTESKKKIEEELKTPVRFFSYPYGTVQDFDDRVVTAVRGAGYLAAFTAVFGTNRGGSDLFRLRRVSLEASDSLFTLRAKLNGALSLLRLFHNRPVRTFIRKLDGLFIKNKKKQAGVPAMLLASVDFPPHTDGVTTIARELSCRIAARRPDFFVLAPQDTGDRAFDEGKGYRALRVPGYGWGYLRIVPMLVTMPYLILRRNIRHVLALNIGYGGLIAWAFSYFLKIRTVLFAYGYEFEKVKKTAWLRRIYLAIYNRSVGVVCCSEDVRGRLVEFGVPAEKTLTLYPGVDTRRFQPDKPPAEFVQSRGLGGRRILLTVGRLVDRKGHDKVVRAVARLAPQFPELLYVISGKGESEGRLKQLVADLKIESHVRFVGRVSDEEILHYYNLCEFFVMPSREITGSGHVEGLGIVYLEAGACGKPSIGGRSGGVREAIWDGRTGLLVDPESVDDLVLKMETLLKDKQYCRSLGENARNWVHTRFHWQTYVRRVYSLLMNEELP